MRYVLLAFLALSPIVLGISIGSSPPTAELGILKIGEERLIEHLITSDYGKDMEISLSYIDPQKATLEEGFQRTFYVNLSQVSDQPMAGWVSFPQSKIITRAEKKLFYLGKQPVWANGVSKAILRVPQNAEPGYHLGAISLGPIIGGAGSGAGLSIIGLSRPGFTFIVDGKAERKGEIIDIKSSNGKIVTIFKNTGTVSIASRNSIDIEGKSYDGGLRIVKPSEIAEFSIDSKKDGLVDVKSSVNWRTGSSSMEKEVISESVSPEKTPSGNAVSGAFNPLIFFFVIAAYIAIRLLI